MADALELGLDVVCGRDIAVRKVPEVEFHSGLQAPFKRHLIDCDRAFSAIHGRGEMPGRIEMRRTMRRQANPFEPPAFPLRQVFLFQPGKKFKNIGDRSLMIEIFDLRTITGRIGGDVVFKGHRNIDELARHGTLLVMAGLVPAIPVFSVDPIMKTWVPGTRPRPGPAFLAPGTTIRRNEGCPLIGLHVQKSTTPSSTRSTPTLCPRLSKSLVARCLLGADVFRSWKVQTNSIVSS